MDHECNKIASVTCRKTWEWLSWTSRAWFSWTTGAQRSQQHKANRERWVSLLFLHLCSASSYGVGLGEKKWINKECSFTFLMDEVSDSSNRKLIHSRIRSVMWTKINCQKQLALPFKLDLKLQGVLKWLWNSLNSIATEMCVTVFYS